MVLRKILFLFLCIFLLVSGSALAKGRVSLGGFETYDVGVQKEINASDVMTIKYITNPSTDGYVKLSGTISVVLKYRIDELAVDYYIADGNEKYVRATSLTLTKGTHPNTFDFEYSYPLDLKSYEYELFKIIIIAEELQNNTL